MQYMGCNHRKSENLIAHLLRVNVLIKLFRVETTTCRNNHQLFMGAIFIGISSIDDKASGTISPARRHLVLAGHGTV